MFFDTKYLEQYMSLDSSRFTIFLDTQFSIYLITCMHKTFDLNLDFLNYKNTLKNLYI
jgi:hypothetical protein